MKHNILKRKLSLFVILYLVIGGILFVLGCVSLAACLSVEQDMLTLYIFTGIALAFGIGFLVLGIVLLIKTTKPLKSNGINTSEDFNKAYPNNAKTLQDMIETIKKTLNDVLFRHNIKSIDDLLIKNDNPVEDKKNQQMIGLMYFTGTLVEQNFNQAINYLCLYETEPDDWFSFVGDVLELIYGYGLGIKRDYNKYLKIEKMNRHHPSSKNMQE